MYWRFVFFLVLSALNLFAQTNHISVPDSFQNFILITRLDSKLDFIHKISATSVSLTSIAKVYRNESLTVIKCAQNVVDANNDYFIEDELLLVFPNGQLRVLESVARYSGKLKKQTSTYWPTAFTISFDDSYPIGEYTLVYRSVNLKTGVERTALRKFLLDKWDAKRASPITEEKDFWQAIKMYHTDQSPEALMRIFESEHCKMLSDKKGSVNYSTFIFLREAFRKKPFLFDVLSHDFDLSDNAKRENTIVLLSALGEAHRFRDKIMTSDEKKLAESIFSKLLLLISPYENRPSNGYQEMLWGEFYAKGNYAPIEFLLTSFSDIDSAKDFVVALKNGKSMDEIEPEKLFASVRCISSVYSVMRNTDVKLAMSYVDFFVQENAQKYPPEKLKSAFLLVNEFLALHLQQKKNKKLSDSKK